MEIKKLQCNNFKAYKDMKLDFSSLNGISLIIGNNHDRIIGESSNGSAKSTILDAIMYAIFGKTATGVSGDSIINRQAKKNTTVKLSFIQNGINYEIRRYRKNAKYKNKVLLFKENEEITQPTNKATDSLILDIVGIKYDTMLSTLFFNSNSINSFINATDKKRKELIENLIDISIYKQAQEKVKDDVNEEKQHSQEIQHKLEVLSKEKESNQKLLDFYNHSKEEKERTLSKLKKEEKQLVLSLKKESNDTSNIAPLQAQSKELTSKINQLQFKDTTQIQQQINTINNQRNQIITQGKQAKKDLVDLNTEYQELANSSQPRCKYCGNLLDTNHREKELKRLATELNETLKTYKDLQKQYSETPNTTLLEHELQEVTDFNNSINSQRSQLQLQINQIQSEIESIKNQKLQYDLQEGKLKQVKHNILELENDNTEPPLIDKSVDKKIENLQEALNKSENNILLLNDLVAIFSDKGVKSQVMANVLPTINQYLKEYLNILSNNSLYAQLSTKTETKTGKQSEKISIKIYSETTGKDFEDLSSGEKKRVAIAINLAFMQFLLKNYNFNVLFLDEIFDSLDGNGIENVENLLQHLKKSNKNLKMFVISHDTTLKNDDIFDNLITVTKIDGCSTVKTRQI